MDSQAYRPRLIDQTAKQYLSAFGAICLEGPLGCGKTRTAASLSQSEFFVQAPDGGFRNRKLAELSPAMALDGEAPRLIDEWQEVPLLWDAVRTRVNLTTLPRQFILTGSVASEARDVHNSGPGRIPCLRMRTMSLFESGDSSGEISLKDLCHGNLKRGVSANPDLYNLIRLIVRGGWPESLDLSDEDAALLTREYVSRILHSASGMNGVKRDIQKMTLLLRGLARHESTTISTRALLQEIKSIEGETLYPSTIPVYMELFRWLFLIEDLPSVPASLRSSVRIRQADKRFFSDPSLACAMLRITPDDLLQNLTLLNSLFESLCVRDFRIYVDTLGGKLMHYQDYRNRKVDAVVSLSDKEWCAFDFRLGPYEIEAAARDLLALQMRFWEDPKGVPPSLLCVVCGLGSAAYQRPDGVFVVPLTALRN